MKYPCDSFSIIIYEVEEAVKAEGKCFAPQVLNHTLFYKTM